MGGLLPGGIRLKGLSGGQKRRLSIAIGIISSPSIVFLDEPTSGLDSFAAVSTMRFVKDLAAKRNHTIIATIHQPRLDIWRLFSRVSVLSALLAVTTLTVLQVLLLSKGMLMYEGSTGLVHSWFCGYLGYSYDPKEDGAISDWCLDLVSIDFAKSRVRTVEQFHKNLVIVPGLLKNHQDRKGSGRRCSVFFLCPRHKRTSKRDARH